MGEYKYKIEFELEQQTPMLHFQHDQKGATLRASEVKPKLDKFLLKILGKGDYDEGKKIAKEKDEEISKEKNGKATWLVGNGEHPALNYKMQIVASGNPEISKDIKIFIKSKNFDEKYKRKFQSSIPKSFFGNMVDLSEGKNNNKSYEVSYNEPIKLTIICFNTELLKFIGDHICSFFLINNFGKRQSKGYGSFIIKKEENNLVEKEDYIVNEIKKIYPTFVYCTYNTNDFEKITKDILKISSILKSGINHITYVKGAIFQYCIENSERIFEEKIINEKAYYKKELLDLIKCSESCTTKCNTEIENDTKEKSYFLRAILGLSDSIVYNNYCKKRCSECCNENKGDKFIEIKGDNIERFQSSILFKYMDKKLFIIPKDCTPILNKTFKFDKYNLKNGKKGDNLLKSIEIKTPPNFDLEDFLVWSFESVSQLKSMKDFKIEKIKVGDEKNA